MSTLCRGGSRGGGGGGGGLWGCNPPKALEIHREHCAGVQIYNTVRAQSTVQPEREKKAGVPIASVRCRRVSWSHAFPMIRDREKMGQGHVWHRTSTSAVHGLVW